MTGRRKLYMPISHKSGKETADAKKKYLRAQDTEDALASEAGHQVDEIKQKVWRTVAGD